MIVKMWFLCPIEERENIPVILDDVDWIHTARLKEGYVRLYRRSTICYANEYFNVRTMEVLP